jgi:hypothetical protein
MAFSFSAFRNLVNSDDLFRANRAELIINKRPAGMSASSIAGASFVGAGGRLSFLIDSFSIPGVSWASSDNIRRYGYGILESRPYTPVFNELPITIMGDRKMEVYKYFHEWTNLVVNYNFLGGGGIGGSYLNTRTVMRLKHLSSYIQCLAKLLPYLKCATYIRIN